MKVKKALYITGNRLCTMRNNIVNVDDVVLYNTKHIVVGDAVTHIGNGAFSRFVRIEDVEIAGMVESIGERAFANCKKLQRVYFLRKLTINEEDSYLFSEDDYDEEEYEGDGTADRG